MWDISFLFLPLFLPRFLTVPDPYWTLVRRRWGSPAATQARRGGRRAAGPGSAPNQEKGQRCPLLPGTLSL